MAGRKNDFTLKVRREEERKVGGLCSNPDCRKPIIGGAVREELANGVGRVSHIHGLSRSCPRWDESLTDEELKSPENAIALCQSCADKIDHGPDAKNRYPASKLREWKAEAIAFAERRLEVPVRGDIDQIVYTVDDSSMRVTPVEEGRKARRITGFVGLLVAVTMPVVLFTALARDPLWLVAVPVGFLIPLSYVQHKWGRAQRLPAVCDGLGQPSPLNPKDDKGVIEFVERDEANYFTYQTSAPCPLCEGGVVRVRRAPKRERALHVFVGLCDRHPHHSFTFEDWVGYRKDFNHEPMRRVLLADGTTIDL
ncbi:MAG: hypothetical protein AAFX94_08970 [Myxococcota bacterium]